MHRSIQVVGPVVVLAVLLQGCTAPGASLPASSPSAEGASPGEAQKSAAALSFPADSLRARLEFPARVRLGHPVPFVLHLHNPTALPVTARGKSPVIVSYLPSGSRQS